MQEVSQLTMNLESKSTTDSSEEVDAFTAEYTKILNQLPSMLTRTEPIPQHLQHYINTHNTTRSSNISHSNASYHGYNKHNKSKSKRKHSRHHKSKHYNIDFEESVHPITIIDDNDHYPPLITDSYFDINESCTHPMDHKKWKHKRKRSKSSTLVLDSIRNQDETSKYYIQSHAHNISNPNHDIVTIQELKRINHMLSSRDHKRKEIETKTPQRNHIQKHISTQTEEIKGKKATKAIQTDEETIEIKNVKINELICNLTKQLNDKTTQCMQVQQDNESLENELKITKKELIESKLEINGWKQQIEDQNIYSNNLIKHLDEKSRNEALLRKEMNEQQKQLEAAHFKLQHFLIPNNKNENIEIRELREHLMISEQKCADWKKKWKQQCCRIEQFESEKVMSEHRVDQQLMEYQKIIQDFRSMMKSNLDSVHVNFQNLSKENVELKNENERLLFELGKFQENAFKHTLKDNTKQDLNEKNIEIHELTQKLNNLQNDLEKTHLNGTMDKETQCYIKQNDDEEFNDISIEIYTLMLNLKGKSNDIIHEYGFKSLMNSPNGKHNESTLYQDTDDVDVTSIIINCKKRFHETKEMLKQLLKWFDDVMYHQAEKQCDQCITQ